MRSLFGPFNISDLEARLVALEAEISERRAEQVTLVNELRKMNAHGQATLDFNQGLSRNGAVRYGRS